MVKDKTEKGKIQKLGKSQGKGQNTGIAVAVCIAQNLHRLLDWQDFTRTRCMRMPCTVYSYKQEI